MSDEGEGGFLLGFVAASMLFLVMAGIYDHHPYRDCEEDEVYTWMADYRASYGESPWECVALDDLK